MIVAVIVLVSAVVVAMVPAATPLASVTLAGWVMLLLLPLEASCTVCPAIGLPLLSRTVRSRSDRLRTQPSVVG